MRAAALLFCLLLLGSVLGCATANDSAAGWWWPRSAVERGRAFAQRACAGCHAIGRQGLSPNPDAPPFRTLAARLPGPSLEAELSSISAQGHIWMPPIYITPAEVRSVAAYIRSVATAARGPAGET